MPLKLHTHDEQRIVFKRPSFGIVNSLFILVGVGLVVGSLTFLNDLNLIGMVDGRLVINYNPEYASENIVIPAALLFFGLITLVVATLLIPRQYRNIPLYIVFDHSKAAMVVTMKDGAEAAIPYRDIAGFDIETRVERDKKLKTYTYHVRMKKKDGGIWDLTSHGNVNDILTSLQKISLDQVAQVPLDEPVLSAKLQKIENKEQSMIAWRNPFSSATFFLILFTILIGTGTVFAVRQDAAWAIPLVMVSLFLVFLVCRSILMHMTRFVLMIEADYLKYYEFLTLTGKKIKQRDIACQSIGRVMYKFSPELQGTSRLWVMTHQEAAQYDADVTDKVKLMKLALSGKAHSLILQIDSLSPVEYIHLENWLQTKLAKTGSL
jgi:hypothetical protein